jgi:hypothetical protein
MKLVASAWVTTAAAAVALAGCQPQGDPMTVAEIGQALSESRDADEAANLISEAVEASNDGDVDESIHEVQTEYSMGERVAEAAKRWRDVLHEELKCADVEVGIGTVEITYGVRASGLDGEACKYGFTGQHNITIDRVPDAGQIEVTHEWVDLSNQKVTVSGGADVTWDLFHLSRRIQHNLTWHKGTAALPFSDVTWNATGDRTQTLLDGNIFKGIAIDGIRNWTRSNGEGEWQLDINQVEVEWSLPAPRTGEYVLSAPNGKSVSMAFEHLEGTQTVRITFESGGRGFQVDLTLGAPVKITQL